MSQLKRRRCVAASYCSAACGSMRKHPQTAQRPMSHPVRIDGHLERTWPPPGHFALLLFFAHVLWFDLVCYKF